MPKIKTSFHKGCKHYLFENLIRIHIEKTSSQHWYMLGFLSDCYCVAFHLYTQSGPLGDFFGNILNGNGRFVRIVVDIL